jgi:hypothetical protein
MPQFDKIKDVSQREVIHRYLPGRSLHTDTDDQFWQVKYLSGDAPTNASENLRKKVSEAINNTVVSQMQQTTTTTQGQNTRLQQLAQTYGQTGPTSYVTTEQVRLIIPTVGKVEIFPRGLNCNRCNYFEIPDVTRQNLNCPNQINGQPCSGTLKQIPRFFVCPQCGKTAEVSPYGNKIRGTSTFVCGDKDGGVECDGIIELYSKSPSAAGWRWICSKTKKEKQVFRYCNICKTPAGKKQRMELPTPFTAFIKPLSMNFLLFGDEKLDEPTDPEWSVESLGSDPEREKLFSSFGIVGITKHSRIQSSSITFGTYRGDVQNVFVRYNEQARKNEYDAYVVQNEGKGLLVEFDKRKLAKCILEYVIKEDPNNASSAEISSKLKELKNCDQAKINEIYNWVYQKSAESFKQDNPFKQLFAVLHTFEHALSKHAALITGLDYRTFTGTVMMSLGAVLVYENQDVSAGGVDYLTDKTRIHDWVFESRRQVANCENYCNDGCGRCVYCPDPMCHPIWSKEIEKSYILPNDMLARKLASELLDL